MATSGFKNNHLTHEQIEALEKEIEECLQTQGCDIQDVYARYKTLSQDNRDEMLACTTIACWEDHRKEILKAEDAISTLNIEAIQAGVLTDSELNQLTATFASGENDPDAAYSSIGMTLSLSGMDFEAYGDEKCGGVYDYTCVQGFQERNTLETGLSSAITAVEVVTPYGTIVDGYACATSMSAGACAIAVASIIPVGTLAKLGGKIFIKRGDEVIEASVDQNGRWTTTTGTSRGARPPVSNPTSAQVATAKKLGVDPRWVKADGTPDWPTKANNGFDGGFDGLPTIKELQPGQTFDR